MQQARLVRALLYQEDGMIEWERAMVDAMRKAAEHAGWAEVARAASDEMDRNDSRQPQGSSVKC